MAKELTTEQRVTLQKLMDVLLEASHNDLLAVLGEGYLPGHYDSVNEFCDGVTAFHKDENIELEGEGG